MLSCLVRVRESFSGNQLSSLIGGHSCLDARQYSLKSTQIGNASAGKLRHLTVVNKTNSDDPKTVSDRIPKRRLFENSNLSSVSGGRILDQGKLLRLGA